MDACNSKAIAYVLASSVVSSLRIVCSRLERLTQLIYNCFYCLILVNNKLILHIQFSTGYVKLSHFCDLLKLDTCHNGLRAVPKLSSNHVEPNNLQRMNVRLAVQVRNFCSCYQFLLEDYMLNV